MFCRSSGSRLPALMSWWRRDQRITSSSTGTTPLLPYSSLEEGSKQQQLPLRNLGPAGSTSLTISFPPSSPASSALSSFNIRETQSPDGNVSLSSLSFVANSEDDGSTITCRVQDTAVPGSDPVVESIRLTVHCKIVMFSHVQGLIFLYSIPFVRG